MAAEIPGYSAPAVGFEVPLEMLAACHARIEQHCAILQRLAQHLRSHDPDEQASAAAVRVKRYFDIGAMDHHADEEIDLFPALIESMAGSDAVCLHGMISALSAEHRELEQRWRRLRVVLQKVAVGMPALLDSDEVDAFVGLYQRHIAREESELLPMAQRLLGDKELDRIGLAMRVRRQALGDMPPAPV